MTIISPALTPDYDAYSALCAGLVLEFQTHDIDEIADRFVTAEAADFNWQARIDERYLGQQEAGFDDLIELDRVAILSMFDGRWHVGVCLIDGEGDVHAMTGPRWFDDRRAAQTAFDRVV